ncbi:hypothetical protein FACS1894156_8870 [Bacteroidia bacterium]|nr:hypothetical protein FACS1894156_8870 [Bacteroidia bacterium]
MQNGYKVEYLKMTENSFDIYLNGISTELKKTTSHNNLVDYAKKAMTSPLLNNNDIQGARHILVNIMMGKNELLQKELGTVQQHVINTVGSQVKVKYGIGISPALADDEVSISLVATGFYVNERQKQGLWQYFDKGLLTMQETYNDSEKLTGEQLHYYPQSEQLYERRRFANGLQTGLYEQWDTQGRMQFEMMYKDGVQEGKVRYYYPNNQIRIEGQYQNNLRVGTWTFYDIHGKVLRSVEYNNGVASDQDMIDQINSNELKRLEQNKGLYEEPETMMQEL